MPTIRTITIKNGEKFILPKNATILSITTEGSITVDSTCDNLPDVTEYVCHRYFWEDTSGSSAYNDAGFTSIQIGSTVYGLLDVGITNTYDNGGNFLASSIPASIPIGLVIVHANAGGEAVNPKCIVLKVPEGIPSPIINWVNSIGGATQHSSMTAESNECEC